MSDDEVGGEAYESGFGAGEQVLGELDRQVRVPRDGAAGVEYAVAGFGGAGPGGAVACELTIVSWC